LPAESVLFLNPLLAQALLGASHQALEDALPRLVVDDEVADRVALRRRVLGVTADVEVEPSTVLEEHVARPAPRDDPPEQVAGDLVGAEAALAAERARDAVLVLEPEDAPFHNRSVPGLPRPADPVAAGPGREEGPQACAHGPSRRSELGYPPMIVTTSSHDFSSSSAAITS
jgi:hypothetical protein